MKMAALKTVYAIFLILPAFPHSSSTNKTSSAIVGPGHEFLLQSILGNDVIVPKLIGFVEQLIAPILTNSTNALCRKHSDIYIDGLKNGTSWAYHSK